MLEIPTSPSSYLLPLFIDNVILEATCTWNKDQAKRVGGGEGRAAIIKEVS